MFKRSRSSEAFFKKPSGKQLKEEEALIRIIRKQQRQNVISELLKQSSGKLPQASEVEEALDFLIEDLRTQGILEGILQKYLQRKIAEERAQAGMG